MKADEKIKVYEKGEEEYLDTIAQGKAKELVKKYDLSIEWPLPIRKFEEQLQEKLDIQIGVFHVRNRPTAEDWQELFNKISH